MNVKEQILTLLQMYSDGAYDTKTFCDLFCTLYFFESDGRCYFSYAERETLDSFAAIAERYSDDKADSVKHPGTYTDEQAIKTAFGKVRDAFRF